MNKITIRSIMLMVLFSLVYGCSDEIVETTTTSEQVPLIIKGSIEQENISRANENGFVDGDRMGVYVVDYDNGVPHTLQAEGNRANNACLTYSATDGTWTGNTPIYWRDDVTPVDVIGYYPFVNYIGDVNSFNFEVSADQSKAAGNGEMSGYESSDFMYAKSVNILPTVNPIKLVYQHKMAGVVVQLQKGTGISDAEWGKLSKIVLVESTIRQAEINFTTGDVAVADNDTEVIRMSEESGDKYRAVVVPQKVAAGKVLVSLTLDGLTYSHTLTSEISYQGGMQHNFTLTVNKRDATGNYEIIVTDDGISSWVNDESSHQFESNAYVVVHVETPGSLIDCITAAGYSCAEVKNLKLTGTLNNDDFTNMRANLTNLVSINIKEVKIVDIPGETDNLTGKVVYEDVIPREGFCEMQYLRQVILPTSIKGIGNRAFTSTFLTSELVIPEGVTHIYDDAFWGAKTDIQLPYSLEYIGGWAFASCQVDGILCRGELRLTNKIKYIGTSAFWRAHQFYGTFSVPANIEYLGAAAFEECGRAGGLNGNIEIPSTLTEIPNNAFDLIGINEGAKVIFHDGIKRIGHRAFAHMKIKNSLILPNSLEYLADGAFFCAEIKGSCVQMPESLKDIGPSCFSETNLEGIVDIPENITIIPSSLFSRTRISGINLPKGLELIENEAFSRCTMLKGITIPKYVNFIGENAFYGCNNLSTLIVLSGEPPVISDNTFNGVYFDKCVLQVPEESVELYRRTDGWNKFQNITAYRELAYNIPEIKCLDKSVTREGIMRAEGAWSVKECPDWVTITPSSGSGKSEVSITVSANTTNAYREGNVVFQLDGKDYTTYTTIRQYAYEYAEDTEIILQEASAGAPNAIPLFIVGEGFDAEHISNGSYLQLMREQMEYFFALEPFKSYRNYFTVTTAIACSSESGVGNITTIVNNKFDTYDNYGYQSDNNAIYEYAKNVSAHIDNNNISKTTILVLVNQERVSGNIHTESDGRTIAFVAKSSDTYPYNQVGIVSRYVAGAGFGKLGEEDINHFDFIKACCCPGCNQLSRYYDGKSLGWYENITISNRMNEAPWYDLMFDARYSQYVDMYEGGFNHARGVWRSENQSIMGQSFLHYFNTVSRRSIVKRIKQYAGETYSYEDFVAKDIIEIPIQ